MPQVQDEQANKVNAAPLAGARIQAADFADGSAIQQGAQRIAGAVDNWAEQAQKDQIKFDVAAAKRAETLALTEVSKVKAQYLLLTGKDAVEGRKQAEDAIAKIRNDQLKALGNQNQSEAFTMSFDARTGSDLGDIAEHEVKQIRAFEVTEAGARFETAMDRATENWMSGKDAEAEREFETAMGEQSVINSGAGPEAMQKRRRAVRATAVKSVVARYATPDANGHTRAIDAVDFIDKNKDWLSADEESDLMKVVTPALEDEEADANFAAVAKLVTEGPGALISSAGAPVGTPGDGSGQLGGLGVPEAGPLMPADVIATAQAEGTTPAGALPDTSGAKGKATKRATKRATALKFDVPPSMASLSPTVVYNRMFKIEDGLNPDGSFRISPAGAVGPGQVMPGTAPEAARYAGLPFDDWKFRNDKDYNIALGKAYFNHAIKVFGGDVLKAAAAYNAGPGNGRDGKGVKGAMARAAKAGHPELWMDYLPRETKVYYVYAANGGSIDAARKYIDGGGKPSGRGASNEAAAGPGEFVGSQFKDGTDRGKWYNAIELLAQQEGWATARKDNVYAKVDKHLARQDTIQREQVSATSSAVAAKYNEIIASGQPFSVSMLGPEFALLPPEQQNPYYEADRRERDHASATARGDEVAAAKASAPQKDSEEYFRVFQFLKDPANARTAARININPTLLHPDDYAELRKMQIGLTTGKGFSDAEHVPQSDILTTIDRRQADYGIPSRETAAKPGKEGQAALAKRNKLLTQFERRVRQQEQLLGRALTSKELDDVGVAFARTLYRPDGSSLTIGRSLVEGLDHTGLSIPPADRARIVERIKARKGANYAPTEREIKVAYTAGL